MKGQGLHAEYSSLSSWLDEHFQGPIHALFGSGLFAHSEVDKIFDAYYSLRELVKVSERFLSTSQSPRLYGEDEVDLNLIHLVFVGTNSQDALQKLAAALKIFEDGPEVLNDLSSETGKGIYHKEDEERAKQRRFSQDGDANS